MPMARSPRALARQSPRGRATVQNAANTGNGGERGLSSRRVQEHADWYSNQAYWHYNKNALDAGALDAELRAILRKEVFPEHVEIEFERVIRWCSQANRKAVRGPDFSVLLTGDPSAANKHYWTPLARRYRFGKIQFQSMA
jgi:hypothetical protein